MLCPRYQKALRKTFQTASEMTEAEILEDFPDLTREDLKACIAYAADRERRLMTAPIVA